MDKFIKITNKSDGVSRIALEKLGLSTKRNDPSTIGQFGSGIKYAPIAALRMGLEWYFTGHDDKGSYVLTYGVEKEDGVDCIVYNYGDYTKPSSFTLEAGVLSWEDKFQIYREAIANAMDEAKTTKTEWTRSIVGRDKIKSVDGEFSVFITASPDMIKIFDEHDGYFLDQRKPLYVKNTGYPKVSIYEPHAPNQGVGIYCKSVLVYDSDEYHCLFDYELDTVPLNEQRTVSSVHAMNYMIARGIAGCNDERVINKLLTESSKLKDYFEFISIQPTDFMNFDSHEQWLYQWNEIYGEDTIVLSVKESSRNEVNAFLKTRGIKFVIHVDNVYYICKNAGVKTLEDVADTSLEYDIDDDISKYPKLVQAMSIVEKYEPRIKNVPKGVSVFTSKQNSFVYGLLTGKTDDTKHILIEKNHAENGSIQEIIATLIHECDHFIYNVGDGSDPVAREFRNLADTRIGELVYKMYMQELVEVSEDGIEIPIENVSALGGINFNIINKNDTSIMFIGNKLFYIHGEDIPEVDGVAESIDNGKKFVINMPNVTYVERII
jgi:hypothetical protein